MKIKFYCPICMHADGVGAESQVFLAPTETGLYNVKCSQGHITPTILQQTKFEVLFEIGVNAIADGYFREAISSFAAALERFFEFYVSMVFKERGVEEKLFDKTWKQINSQSERQLGAYLFLYALHEGTEPLYLKQQFVEMRNQVVHKGKFPQRDEAIRFGNAVLAIINPTIRNLKTRCPKLIIEAIQKHQRDAAASTKEVVTHGYCVNMTISLAYDVSVSDCEDIGNLPKLRN
jgi:hypothetical protein